MADMLCPVVVGRSAELAGLAGALDAAARGAGSTVLVTGEAGVGKSRLLREVRRWCTQRKGANLVGRAVDTALAAPFRPLAEALLAAYRAGAVRDEPDVAPFRAALGRLVPDSAGGRVDPADSSLLHIAEGFLRVARSLGRRRGQVVVLLDDLHWADGETLEVVEYLADNVGAEPVLLILSARDGVGSDAVGRVIALADRRAAVHMHLSRLSPEQTVEMARVCLGDAAVPARVLELISGRADGLPFFVEELLAGLVSDGALIRQGDGWVATVPERTRPPVSFAESIRRRFTSLSASAQQVLYDAALLGRRIDADLLADLSGLDRTEIDDALAAAQQLALLVPDDLGMKFRHALTRDALFAQLSPSSRATRARQALDVLRVARPELDGDLAEVAAELAVIAGDRAVAAALLLEVGRRALHQGALTSAESALRRARPYAAGSALDLEVTELLVETLSLVGHVDEAFPEGEVLLARLTDAARTADPDGHRRTDVHLALARAAVACTDWSLAASHLQRAGEFIAAAPDLIRTARIDTMRALVALGEGRLDDAETLAPAAGDSAECTGVADLHCEALLVHGRCARTHNLDTAERSFDRARVVAREAGLVHREARALTELGFIDAWRDGGSARLLEARDLAAACGSPETEAVAENALAAAAWFRGDTDALRSHATAALALSRRFRLGVMVPSALVLLAGAHALCGDAAAMEVVLAEAAPLLADEPTQLIARHAHCLAVCALAHDDLVTARAEFAAAAAIVRDRPVATVPPLAVMHVLVGAVEGADPASRASDFGQLRDLDVPLMAALMRAAEAVNLGHGGDGAAATTRMEHALHDLQRNSFVQAAVVRIVAPSAVVNGWGDPAGWLVAALATFEARDLPEPAKACRDLLRELGAPAAWRAASDDGLSGREREVLQLVAEGLANKTIAQRLFLSPRTVEKHVERLLAKTKSTNRAQLVTYALSRSPFS